MKKVSLVLLVASFPLCCAAQTGNADSTNQYASGLHWLSNSERFFHYEPNFQHFELRDGEQFLENVFPKDTLSWRIQQWKTRRYGTVAFQKGGPVIPHMIPVFVQKREVLYRKWRT